MNKSVLLAIVIALCFSQSVHSIQQSDNQLSLTIYDTFGYVRDVRLLDVAAGTSTTSFTDVASRIDPQTVTVKDLTHPDDVSVVQQVFNVNLVNSQQLSKKFIGQIVDVYLTLGTTSRRLRGQLLSANGGCVIRNSEGVFSLYRIDAIDYPNLPSGFYTVPTLTWTVTSAAAYQKDQIEVVYRAQGFSWTADYTLILNAEMDNGIFSGWVSIENRSGKRYMNSNLKLVAGSVNTVQPVQEYQREMMPMASMMMMDDDVGAPAPPTVSDLGDFKLYTIGFPVDINDNSQTQVQLIAKVDGVPVLHYGEVNFNTGGYEELEFACISTVQFANTQANGLGIALPAGTYRCLTTDPADDTLEFIGEFHLDHKSTNETIKIVLGTAFDLKANKTVESRLQSKTKQKIPTTPNFKSTQTVTIANHKNLAAIVRLNLNNNSYDDNLAITWKDPTKTLTKKSAFLYTADVTVPAGGTYTISWDEKYEK